MALMEMDMATPGYAQVRRQIAGDPCSRQRRASSAQLDYLARLIVECEGKPGFRWDYTHPETFTAHRAALMIESLKRIAEQVSA